MHGGRIAPSEGGREGGNEGWGEGGGREWWKEGRGKGWREDGGTESGSERGGNEGWGRRDGGSERKRERCRKINLTASFLDSALLIAGGHFGAYHSSSSCAIGVLVRWCGGAVWRQPSPGVNTFPINKRLLTGVLTVTDDEVRYAMRVAFETLQVGAHSPEEAERHMGASKQDPLPPSSSSPPPPFFLSCMQHFAMLSAHFLFHPIYPPFLSLFLYYTAARARAEWRGVACSGAGPEGRDRRQDYWRRRQWRQLGTGMPSAVGMLLPTHPVARVAASAASIIIWSLGKLDPPRPPAPGHSALSSVDCMIGGPPRGSLCRDFRARRPSCALSRLRGASSVAIAFAKLVR